MFLNFIMFKKMRNWVDIELSILIGALLQEVIDTIKMGFENITRVFINQFLRICFSVNNHACDADVADAVENEE